MLEASPLWVHSKRTTIISKRDVLARHHISILILYYRTSAKQASNMSGAAYIVIRKMIPADGDALSNMMASLAAYHGDVSKVKASDFLARGVGESRLADIWLALANEAYAGFAATYDWMNFVQGYPVRHIDLIFVEDRLRKMGIGSTLIKEISVNAKLSSCERVTVGASKSNSAANDFYIRLGFKAREETSIRYQLSGAALDRLTLSA